MVLRENYLIFSTVIIMKAFKKDDTILLAQRRAGLAISTVAFIAIIVLVIVKPVFA